MPLKGLYVITDPTLTPRQTLSAQVEAALIGGARIVQFRDKSNDQRLRQQQAQQLRDLCNTYKALLVINDDLRLCQDCDADGVHLGQDDCAVSLARRTLGPDKVIGATCHGSVALAQQAIHEGADYLAFGRFFPSATKPGAPAAQLADLKGFLTQCPLPTVAIGGITLNNAAPLVEAGFDMLAVIQDVFGQPDITRQCEHYQAFFQ